ncbi:YceI family protein [Algiphilus sp.]|uniref:YceI family protein n=1 Tax=Algiphilus sp. TaxID=1872431 RepID=UPI0025C5821C|nr:YceI family protein [Algiphilus sp.]MCK5770446.1 polyisoprenoid-binding protein [Algiphilus sp.]
MQRLLAAGFAGAVLSVTAVGAQAAEYEIDPTHTFAHFEISHLGLSHFTGRFEDIDGTVTFDAEAGTGSADIVIDASSVSTGVADLDEHLRNEDFFHVEKYPEIRFSGDDFEVSEGKIMAVTGELTLLGETKPVTLKFSNFNCIEHPMRKVPACGGNAVTRIMRSAFGMDAYVPAVGDEVKLSIEVEAFKPKEGEG